MGFVYRNSILPKDSKLHIAPRGGFYYRNDFWYSKAYQDLPNSARNLLHCLINELRWTKEKGKRIYTNNGEISFTETQFKKLHGKCSETYLKARNMLITNGLIEQTHRGGYGKGDRSKYKLLFIDGTEQRWRDYPESNCACDIPTAKECKIGIKTRFKESKSGKNSKSTLLKCTLNESNNPTKVDPKQ